MKVARQAGEPGARVLVIYKKSAYQIYVRERRHGLIERLIEKKDPTVAPLLRAHKSHLAALAQARAALLKLGARASFRHRSQPGHAQATDLVVTLGGDGTLLWASHHVGSNVPVVAINTAPKDSVGYFCAGTRHELADVLADALRARLRATSLSRMRVDVDGELVSSRVLNDVLFCHNCPASTSRYSIRLGRAEEEQKSSGLWVGPAAGSTAAQHSAGGRILPLASRQLQFVVREPYEMRRNAYKLKRGLVQPGQRLVLQSHMRAGRLYVDGPHAPHVIEMASRIELQLSHEPLTLLGFRTADRKV